MNLANRDFISINDFDRSALEGFLHHAVRMKRNAGQQKSLHDKHIGTLFSAASTRTRISFQIADRTPGPIAGHASAADVQMSHPERLKATALVTSRYLDGLVVRISEMRTDGAGRAALDLPPQYAEVAVINALDDKDHPCRAIADLAPLDERYGKDDEMDCVPFICGEQVAADVADGPQSMMYDQAENRLHAQQAILSACISA